MRKTISIASLLVLTLGLSSAQATVVDQEKPKIDYAAMIAKGRLEKREKALVANYVAFAGLQFGDALSTHMFLKRGIREGNILMKGCAEKPACLIGVKAGATVGTLYLVDQWVRPVDKKVALVQMTIMNSLMGYVVTRNFGFVFTTKVGGK